MKHLFKNKLICVLFVCAGMAIIFYIYINGQSQKEERTTVTIAVLQNDYVQNFNTNYYTQWLEEQTGYDIQFEYISEGYEKEYLYACLTSDKGKIDAMFLPEKESCLTTTELQNYAEEGMLFDMSGLLTQDSHFTALLNQYDFMSMRDKIEYQGGIYYMPNMDTTRRNQNMQVMWINMGWLKTLGLKVPKTVEELKTVLTAFCSKDPNGNGLADELPLISCESSYALQSYNFILNAYIYNDPLHNRMYVDENGNFASILTEPDFREGLQTCADMYSQGLLSGECNYYSQRQLMELVNAQGDYVGAFTSQSIADIIYPNCPDILARYIQVPPLLGTEGERNAVYSDYEPNIGGYIPANSAHTKEAFEIMDLMLSKEASFIASFGEEGVDWKFSENGDLSTYGSKAVITTLQYLNNRVQNKNFAGAGPLVLAGEYTNGVTWNGDNSLVEYMDARAVRSYENYYYERKDVFQSEKWQEEASDRIDGTIDADTRIRQFIFGEEDISLDEIWKYF
ncbi:type 2 periplasmic-binding domain-containing protein [Anaerovorax odorimutans]|uniref:extracellular solute-binding protein n=1 Tax=Anaerovorax odorimutans TaxID=109327 RepID=UPI0004113B4E|nr:extracellular solute-binding protein [Anaerovorax odorimutans]